MSLCKEYQHENTSPNPDIHYEPYKRATLFSTTAHSVELNSLIHEMFF